MGATAEEGGVDQNGRQKTYLYVIEVYCQVHWGQSHDNNPIHSMLHFEKYC
jgi:hypothetical protein